MAKVRQRTLSILAIFLFALGTTCIAPTPAYAAPACYGASCTGLDPEGRCSHDAQTVRAIHVTDGMLNLRWSPSCAANWGRYTPYSRTVTTYSLMNPPIGIWARVTVWNPGEASQGSAHNASLNIYESSWSLMADGTKKACTGVEILYTFGNGDNESQGWTWGPCY